MAAYVMTPPRTLAVLAGGMLFGFGLALSTMVQPEVVLSFLRFQDGGLMLVMGGALAVTLLVLRGPAGMIDGSAGLVPATGLALRGAWRSHSSSRASHKWRCARPLRPSAAFCSAVRSQGLLSALDNQLNAARWPWPV